LLNRVEFTSNKYRIIFDVDLDEIMPDLFNGTIFMTQMFFDDIYLSNTDVSVFGNDYNYLTSFTTDVQGRFAIDINDGHYFFEFNDIYDYPEYHWHDVIITENYQDFKFPQNSIMLKPNIYIYPEENMDLLVQIDFPEYGFVTTSVPDYGDGWDISVEPCGVIDGQYEYLFYESVQPDRGQYSKGWVIPQEGLTDFFSENMAETGFNAKEITDFIDYWIPLLTEYQYYAIYPQYNEQLDSMIRLEFSEEPDNIIRLLYSIRGLNQEYVLPEPEIPNFNRAGFTVAEWGVILK